MIKEIPIEIRNDEDSGKYMISYGICESNGEGVWITMRESCERESRFRRE